MGLAHMAEMRDDLMGFCTRLKQEFGDIVHFRLGALPCFQLTHPEHLHEVLVQKAASFRKQRRLKQVFGRFEGNGLVVSDGPLWERQRRIVQPAFAPSRLPEYAALMRPCVEEMLADWNQIDRVDIVTQMRHLMLRIIARTLFSADVDDVIAPLAEAVSEIQQWSMQQMHRVIATPNWLPLWGASKARRAIKLLHREVQRIIRLRQSRKTSENDLLGQLIAATDVKGQGQRMSNRQLHDELVTMLLAGHETSAAAVTWSVWLLAKHPEIQQQVATEVERALHGRAPTFADIPQLAGVEQVFKEAMRLFPPVYFLSREAVDKVEVGGYVFPPNSQVFLVPYLSHRDSRWFAEPERFDPLRFTHDSEAQLPPCCYFPFGAGPRACVGRGFAMLEGTLVLAAILQMFELQTPLGASEPVPAWQLSLHPQGKLEIAICSRSAT